MQRERHTFTALNTTFVINSEYEFVKELGQGAFGCVVAAKHKRTGKGCAIKKLTNINTKRILTRRCLREIKLLHHFRGHKNIICPYDMDIVFGSDRSFDEVYLYQELMEADLHAIIRSGQPLSDAHFQSFIYQTLCGLKYIHSAEVLHRDVQPGNLLVNADCEVKICDFGLARGFSQSSRKKFMTDYVATRWYRAPEVMLSYTDYASPIDVWSVGCVLGELLAGKPMFKGRNYPDQLRQILHYLGTPSEDSLRRLCSDSALCYIRSLPTTPRVPFTEMFPHANPLALDLLAKMLTFVPAERITCEQALEHPYLAVWHDPADEPVCPTKFVSFFEDVDSIEGLKKHIVEEVTLFQLELCAETESDQNRHSMIPSCDDIVASPIRGDAPQDRVTSDCCSDQTPQQGAGGGAGAIPDGDCDKMHRDSDLHVVTMQSRVVSPKRELEDGDVRTRQPDQSDQRIKQLEDELDKFRRRAEEQNASMLALQKELDNVREEARRAREQVVARHAQQYELQIPREHCERLEEQIVSPADSEIVERLLLDTESEMSDLER